MWSHLHIFFMYVSLKLKCPVLGYTEVFRVLHYSPGHRCSISSFAITGQVGLGVGSWPNNRVTEELNTKGTRLYFVILLKNVEKIFDWH